MLRLGVSNTRRRLHHPLQRTCPEIQRRFSTKKPFGPLRILFCGSDDFSAASLQALHAEHRANSDIISSLQVVCKKPKLTGRGLKVLREGEKVPFQTTRLLKDPVPIATLARNLSLPLHEIDTFRGWQVSLFRFKTVERGRSMIERGIAPDNRSWSNQSHSCGFIWAPGTSATARRG